jgi:predicted transcriptional regulator of viral defense system
MKQQQLIQKIETLGKGVFTINDLKKLFPEDAYIKTSVYRMLKRGNLVQIVRGMYALNRNDLDIEKVAAQLYYPSYVSFESALARYGIINQGPYGLTLATTRHSKQMTIAGVECSYSRLKPALFFGFDLIDGVYLAAPEKAVLDELYLICLGKRKGETSEWYLESLDRQKVREYLKPFSSSVQKKASEMGLDRLMSIHRLKFK